MQQLVCYSAATLLLTAVSQSIKIYDSYKFGVVMALGNDYHILY